MKELASALGEYIVRYNMVTSMLVTDVRDLMCWRQVLFVVDNLRHQHQELRPNRKY